MFGNFLHEDCNLMLVIHSMISVERSIKFFKFSKSLKNENLHCFSCVFHEAT